MHQGHVRRELLEDLGEEASIGGAHERVARHDFERTVLARSARPHADGEVAKRGAIERLALDPIVLRQTVADRRDGLRQRQRANVGVVLEGDARPRPREIERGAGAERGCSPMREVDERRERVPGVGVDGEGSGLRRPE